MSITIDRLLSDPNLYFHSFEADFARFVAMDRDHYERSIFLDRRIARPGDEIFRIPLDLLQQALSEQPGKAPRIHFIHHVAQTGSTLLARALDRNDSLVFREPFHLRQLGAQIGAAPGVETTRFDPWRDLLTLSLQQLSKRYDEDQAVVVKGNVPTSMIADTIAKIDPGQSGILLYFPLDDYLAAVLRTPNHGQWVESIAGEMRLALDSAIGDLSDASTPQKAGALWTVLMRKYHALQQAAPGMASLDANLLFDEPAKTIAASAGHLGIDIGDEEAGAIADGPLFRSYAKNPEIAYDPAQRIERREETKRELAEALGEARRWVEDRADFLGLPEMLSAPLAGAATPLL